MVKLGDFGLAKHNAQGGDAELATPGGGGGSGEQQQQANLSASDTTGVCGTGYYISPEIAAGWPTYDERVDLFSLGVMAFELWHPFATAMERAVLLRQARLAGGGGAAVVPPAARRKRCSLAGRHASQRSAPRAPPLATRDLREREVLPPGFEETHPTVARVIRWLMARNPAERPTAREVLRSELLPPQVLDEQVTDLLRSLPDNPATHDRVVEGIFSLSRGPADAAAGGGNVEGVAGAPNLVPVCGRCCHRRCCR